MVGFNPSLRSVWAWQPSDLHSIMVGFNLGRDAGRESRSGDDLHSIMVGFNRGVDRIPCFLSWIYIPLWSDSIPARLHGTGSATHIYIPLWSDSISIASISSVLHSIFTFHYGRIQSLWNSPCSRSFSHLHSIMVGFNHWVRRRVFVHPDEFTFHYGRIQSFGVSVFAILTDSFTFHYGRIQSVSGRASFSRCSWFTFHYGRIQSPRLSAICAYVLHLHSIMVGFNRQLCRDTKQGRIYLHSIMVGFNPDVPELIKLYDENLHSIMVGFNPWSHLEQSTTWYYLHSIMVGFNLIPVRDQVCLTEIYIPLWSDSILLRSSWPSLWSSFTFHYGRIQSPANVTPNAVHHHLHSIMVGFNHAHVNSVIVGYLHLHSIMVGFNLQSHHRTGRQALIYIPLWSDSIAEIQLENPLLILFTFHYGRIQSAYWLCPECGASVFTFHYGRIQSILTIPHQHSQQNLHSIMVGFNRGIWYRCARPATRIYIPLWSDSIEAAACKEPRPCLIYIPLWSDSIWAIQWIPCTIHKFTFHYGRIQSEIRKSEHLRRNIIYIPLWSDSILPHTSTSQGTFSIYIPLWSDSISSCSVFLASLPKFTFHYGRIQSRM